MSTTSLPSPQRVVAPRFAAPAAAWFARLLEVISLAHQIHVGRRMRLQRIGESASLRRHADSLRDVDPRYASDLYAAADRHDRGM